METWAGEADSCHAPQISNIIQELESVSDLDFVNSGGIPNLKNVGVRQSQKPKFDSLKLLVIRSEILWHY